MRKTIFAVALLFFLCITLSHMVHAAQTVRKTKQSNNSQNIPKNNRTSVIQQKKQNNQKSTKLPTNKKTTVRNNKKKPVRYTLQKNTAAKKKETPETGGFIGENDGEFIEYKVKKDDTIDSIASFFNVDKEELIESNSLQNLANKKLSPGTVILIPKIIDEGEEEIVSLTNKPLKPWKNNDEKYMLVKVAKSFMGAPYKYGGTTVKGLDCSAYVKKIYEIFDVQLPRSARDQFQIGSRIKKEELAVGDLVFFKTRRHVKYPTHVGIYIGDSNFIHSSSGNGRIGVKIDSLSSDYYSKAFTGATRVKEGLFEERSDTASTASSNM